MSQDVGTRVYRDKYRKSTLDHLLRNALIAEKVCDVDRTDSKRIQSPYGSTPTSTVAAIAGSYSLADWQLVDDTLTVTDYVSVAEHIYDFEEVLTSFDVFASRMDQQAYSVAAAIDKFALNELCEGGNGTYSTPSGGFTTAANIPVIMSNLLSKVAGYSEMYKGTYLVIESTDVPGFIQSQAASGFSFADAALNNGFMTNYMGVEVYVAPAGTFVDASTTSASGTKTWTNDDHRVFGVKGMTTYAAPRGIQFTEKEVTLKTGVEIATWGYIGFKVWVPKQDLTVDVTITA